MTAGPWQQINTSHTEKSEMHIVPKVPPDEMDSGHLQVYGDLRWDSVQDLQILVKILTWPQTPQPTLRNIFSFLPVETLK